MATNVVTPGEVVSAVVTEDYLAINHNHTSPYLPTLIENASSFGLEVIPIEKLAELAMEKANEMGTLMKRPEFTDDIIFAAEWRDGRLIDVVRKLAD